MTIETKRLLLREMTEEDFNALYQVLADSDIMQHYPYVFDEGRVRNWITRNRERYQIFGFGLWAVVLKQTGEMIGDCGLTMQKIGETIKPEIGYHIRKDQQRKGYAKALIEFLVEKYRGQFSILQVGTGDSPLTIPFYEKCGFVRSHTVPNFFTDHYDHPIYECGVHLVDMVYLQRPL